MELNEVPVVVEGCWGMLVVRLYELIGLGLVDLVADRWWEVHRRLGEQPLAAVEAITARQGSVKPWSTMVNKSQKCMNIKNY